MKKIELATKVAENMKKVKPELNVERTAKLLARKMMICELEACLRNYNK